MKFLKFDKRSIAFKLLSLIITIVLGQAALLSFFLIFGGVIDQAEKNAYSSFAEKVRNRRDYLQKEMSYKWINMDPYLDQISELYRSGEESRIGILKVSVHPWYLPYERPRPPEYFLL